MSLNDPQWGKRGGGSGPPDLDEILFALRDWALKRYPHLRPGRLRLELDGRERAEETVELPIPLAGVSPPGDAGTPG